jgi:hypothetical protein
MTATPEVKTSALLRLRLRREIAQVSDGYYKSAEELARRMKKADLRIAQVRGLENVAYTTDKVSDILDLIKRQIGRGRWPIELGEDLLNALGDRRAEAKQIAQRVDPKGEDDDLPRRTHLLLCREFIKHLATHFVYLGKLSGEER